MSDSCEITLSRPDLDILGVTERIYMVQVRLSGDYGMYINIWLSSRTRW